MNSTHFNSPADVLVGCRYIVFRQPSCNFVQCIYVCGCACTIQYVTFYTQEAPQQCFVTCNTVGIQLLKEHSVYMPLTDHTLEKPCGTKCVKGNISTATCTHASMTGRR